MSLEIERTHYESCIKAREKLHQRVLDGERPNLDFQDVEYHVVLTMATCVRCKEFVKAMQIMRHNAALKKKKAHSI